MNDTKFNFIDPHSTNINKATTERLQLFNPSSKKKRPPTKINMINPLELKDVERNLQAVLNGNKSHELIPYIIQGVNPNSIVSLLDKVNDKMNIVSFSDYYQEQIDDSKHFYNNVELYLRELKFQQEYVTIKSTNIELGLTNNPLQGTKTMTYDNYQNDIYELTPEDYQEYKKKQAELELSIDMKKKELDKETEYQLSRKKEALEKIRKENSDKWIQKVKDAIKRDKELRKQAMEADEKARKAEEERRQKEQEQQKIQKKAMDEKIQAMKAAYQSMIEKENAIKAAEAKEKADREVEQRKQVEEEWKKKIETIRDTIIKLSEQKKEQEELKRIEKEKEAAERAAIEEHNVYMRKQLEEAYKKQAKRDFENLMKMKKEREEQIAIEQETAKQAEIEAKKAKEEWMKARLDAFIKAKEEYQAKEKAKQEEILAQAAEKAKNKAEQQQKINEALTKKAIENFVKQQKEAEILWKQREEAKQLAIEAKKEQERQEELAREEREKAMKLEAEKRAEQEEIASRISVEQREKKLKEYRDWLIEKRKQAGEKMEQKLNQAKQMGKVIMNETNNEKNRARNNIIQSEKTDTFQGMTSADLTKLLIVFNFEFYRTHYDDVKELSISECLKHYLTIGKKEGRIISKKHAQYITGVPDFDIIYYKKIHPDLSNLTLREICAHYISHGKEEHREFKRDFLDHEKMSLTSDFIEQQSAISDLDTYIHDAFDLVEPNIDNQETPNICIIYPYYEKSNYTKNQTNLAYFLKYAMNKSLWRNVHITLLLMINGHNCEVQIPLRDDIIVWKRDYNGERDIGSYKLGIHYMEKLHNKKFYEIYNYLFILNSSVTGPFWTPNKNNHWLDPFMYKMAYDNSVICSPVINFLKANDAGGPGPRCQTYCSLIKINQQTYNLLLNTKITKVCPRSLTTEFKNDLNGGYVFDIHKNISDIILYGEYGLTRVFLENGYNISCMIYDNIDYHDDKIWNKYSDRVDRIDEYKIDYFYKAVFIKNNWSVSQTFKDSLPVLYDITTKTIYDTLSWVDFIKESNVLFPQHFNITPLEPSGEFNIGIVDSKAHLTGTKLLMGSWTTKEENYNLFGISEEVILIPKHKTAPVNICIYTHTDPDNMIRDYVIQGIKTLIILGYDIIFCSSCDHIKNVDLPFPVQYYTFQSSDIESYKHIHMLSNVLQKFDLSDYKHILMLNSTMIFPIHGFQNMEREINIMREKSDFWSLYNTVGLVCGNNTCFEISIKCKDKLVKFFQNQEKTNTNKTKLPGSIELNMVQTLSEHGFSYASIIENPNRIPLRACLQKNSCFSIKLDVIQKYIKQTNHEIKNPVLRFLMRFLL